MNTFVSFDKQRDFLWQLYEVQISLSPYNNDYSMLLEFLHDATDKWCPLPMSQCTVTTADIYFILLRMAILLYIRPVLRVTAKLLNYSLMLELLWIYSGRYSCLG